MDFAYWNYRIVSATDVAYVVECYYNSDDSIIAWTAVRPVGDDVADLRGELERMWEAADRPILTPKDLSGVSRHPLS